jgi:spore photoproduct lyase
VLPAPEGYGIGSAQNFYFSHVLNCLYDCRYCFLQGMYRSAHYVVFVNYEAFQDSIASMTDADPDRDLYFFSGYDGDSLALDAITGFVDSFVPFFALRTKSAAIRPLLRHEPSDNVVVAFSFTPVAASEALEHRVPPLEARVSAMQEIAARGYRLGLRFDPLLYTQGYRDQYRELFEAIVPKLDAASLHSVSFGPFRVPRDYFQRMAKLYPKEKLFAGIDPASPMVSYPPELEAEMRAFCEIELGRLVPAEILFPCRV